MIRKLRHSLPQKSLVKASQSFLTSLVDFGDIIYDKT